MEDTQSAFDVETSGEYTFSMEDAERILLAELPASSTSGRTLRDLYHNFLNLKKREIDLLLHGTYLSNYHRQKIIPRGFRIRNTPPLGRYNQCSITDLATRHKHTPCWSHPNLSLLVY
ncbi:hypothetical protein XELAEV_18010620mg [Xenopus laevis]|uniref:Uncharacterized protein n=1 Tax=Xenopus laevis TaxID=8355 RepID=A0A974I1X6_XENLA|nr:hypothetical protein XELAEV_18010620mg [Xenopus laevis]